MACKSLTAILFLLIFDESNVKAETCTYTRTPRLQCSSSTPVGRTTIDECEAICTQASTCLAIYYDDPVCYKSTVTTTTPKTSAIHSLKHCVADTTSTVPPTVPPTSSTVPPTVPPTSSTVPPTSSTVPPTVPPTSSTVQPATSTIPPTSSTIPPTSSTVPPTSSTVQPPSSTYPLTSTSQHSTPSAPATGICGMLRNTNTKGGDNLYIKVTVSKWNCQQLCLVFDECESVIVTSTACKLYTGCTTKTSQTGSYHASKVKCKNGKSCCWTNTTEITGGDNHALTYVSSLESCESLCLKFVKCTGIYWSGNECLIYTTSTSTSLQTGSTYSTKACTTGGNPGNFSFSDVCITGDSGNGSDGTVKASVFILVVILSGIYLYI